MSSEVNGEISLVKYLKGKYDRPRFLRPVAKATDTLQLSAGFDVSRVSLNEEDGLATITGYLFKTWTDPNLTWDPSKFDGINKIRLPTSEIWMPDMAVEGCDSAHLGDDFMVIVTHAGRVLHFPAITVQLQASLVSEGHFQIRFAMGSWTHDSSALALEPVDPRGVGMDEFVQGPKWNVTNGGVSMATKDYTIDGQTASFPGAVYILDVKKRSP